MSKVKHFFYKNTKNSVEMTKYRPFQKHLISKFCKFLYSLLTVDIFYKYVNATLQCKFVLNVKCGQYNREFEVIAVEGKTHQETNRTSAKYITNTGI